MVESEFYKQFHGPNAGYVLYLYERYTSDPNTVDPSTRAVFERWNPLTELCAASAGLSDAPPAATHSTPFIKGASQGERTGDTVMKVVMTARVARLVREIGHLTAHIDPLGSEPPGDPGLEISTHGLTEDDLRRLPASVIGGPLSQGAANALEALEKLRGAYSRSIGYEEDHIQIDEERNWLRESIETFRFFRGFTGDQKRELLERLTEVETFEQFIHKTYLGQKRFSIEGADMLVPMLDTVIRCQAARGTREVVIGMAHRGRLNVLAHILHKPYSSLLAEFQAAKQEEGASVAGSGTRGWSGDVKYHLGARVSYSDTQIKDMPITLAPNPSHLEFVNPVVEGRARAAQERRETPGRPLQDPKASLAILVHGDAAFPGQGIVAETLNLGQLPGYNVGGTIHIIANNQIGFTTSPQDARSTLYASDLAKGFEIPIVHVNADDPEACIAVSRMACAYRERFHKDFLIDLVGYRRYGHNEGDAPEYTQPRMYKSIAAHPTVRQIWANVLEKKGLASAAEADAIVKRVQKELQEARATPQKQETAKLNELKASEIDEAEKLVPTDRLTEFNEALLVRPPGFTINSKLEAILQRRRAGLNSPGGIDWAHAEALAFAAILSEGVPIRFTGQDTERGTFGHRHLVLHDPGTGNEFCPHQSLATSKASFDIHNSPLSENAALGFEYGYSMHAKGALVLWEAQFGDFANSAQVIIDQFIVSGNSKWQQTPSLVLLLPHGYEGQGAEHSSARIERFLQLASNDNIRIVNCTTSAQYYHVLRRQAALLEKSPRPLIVFSPKWLLRHPLAGSPLSDLTDRLFQPVLDDAFASGRRDRVTRLVVCSGKVWTELVSNKAYESAESIAAIRMEQLYPFPERELKETLGRYCAVRDVIWLQEEPKNMGAWSFVETSLREIVGSGMLRYIGRAPSASPAEGSLRSHTAEQNRIISEALSDIPRFSKNGAERAQTKTRQRATRAVSPTPPYNAKRKQIPHKGGSE